MKKMITFLGALALAVPGPIALPAHADPIKVSELASICKVIVDDYSAYPNVGDCVSLNNIYFNNYVAKGNAAGGYEAHACAFVQDEFPQVFDLFYDSYSDCVLDDATQILG